MDARLKGADSEAKCAFSILSSVYEVEGGGVEAYPYVPYIAGDGDPSAPLGDPGDPSRSGGDIEGERGERCRRAIDVARGVHAARGDDVPGRAGRAGRASFPQRPL